MSMEMTKRYLLLLKVDAENLFERIKTRHVEFMDDFSLKRDRAIFREVFYSRYQTMTMSELAHFSNDVIELANQYYQAIDELYWYLSHTQDMPNTIEDEILRSCGQLERLVENLKLYLEAELSANQEIERESASN